MVYSFKKARITARRTKIVCTLGPSSGSTEQVRALAEAGMDVARMNFSHGTVDEHKARILAVRKVSEELDKPIGILQDLPGPKIRTGRLVGGHVQLGPGSIIVLTSEDISGDEKRVSVSYPELAGQLSPGQRVLIDDGRIELKVDAIAGADVICRVVTGGILGERKGVNLPETRLQIPLPTDRDREYLRFGLANRIDFAALSFVQTADDVESARREIAAQGADVPLVAKIERPQAVREIGQITDKANSVMIARGDLGVEMDPEEVPVIQKEIIALCNRKGVPVITATQMLESMIQNPRPTRAEASDVANAVLDGSDAVMLSGETAVGAYPVEAVRMISRITTLTEQRIGAKTKGWQAPDPAQSVDLAIGEAACSAAQIANAQAIVCLTQSGSTAVRISQFRPPQSILAFTPSPEALKRMTLLWGVTPFLLESLFDDFDQLVGYLIEEFRRQEMVRPGQHVVFTAGLPFGKRRATNMVRIEQV
ncbi:MAG: pyruvate kinase [Acidobacteria bacterium]|nr:MAG: pyruvate kinase [Acidobacteriota bacterium]